MGIENFAVKVVQGGSFYEDQTRPLYDQFIAQKPDVNIFGIDITVGLLRDAAYSLFAYTSKNKNLSFDINALVNYVDKYARVYYLSNDSATEEGTLILLRSIIRDFFISHNINEKKYDELAESVYQHIRLMITITKHE